MANKKMAKRPERRDALEDPDESGEDELAVHAAAAAVDDEEEEMVEEVEEEAGADFEVPPASVAAIEEEIAALVLEQKRLEATLADRSKTISIQIGRASCRERV